MADSATPSEVWDRIDHVSRIRCCHASPGGSCKGHHPQGTLVVYGYEALFNAVRGAVFNSRNGTIDAAIEEISKLRTEDAQVSKAEILEILVRLKLRGV